MRLFVKNSAVCCVLFVLAGMSGAARAQENDKLDAVLAQMPASPAESVWAVGRELEALGAEAVPVLKTRLEGANPGEVVAIGYALLKLGEQKDGTLALQKLARDTQAPMARRVDALDALGSEGGNYASMRLRELLRDEALAERVRLAAAKNLWKLTHGVEALEAMTALMEKARDRAVRAEATLALGRFGRFEEAEEGLTKLAALPGDRGDQARELLVLKRRFDERMSRDSFAADLIGEVVQKVRERYAPDETDPDEAKQLAPKRLASEAARALVRSLDDFNDYLDEEAYSQMVQSMYSKYGGIGAWVGMRDERFTILTPMYDQPAFKAGLKSMDVVTKIDGVDIGGMELNKIIGMLKGEPGTDVIVTVLRRNFDKPRDFRVTRKRIEIPMIAKQQLPGDIGYIRLNGFQDDPQRNRSTSKTMQRAIIDFKKSGMKGLVLDLRNNPGGLLSEAVEVCEKFLPRGKLIVSSKGKIFPEQNYISRNLGQPLWGGPVVVLINEGSASASEIVSGALRDHERATLVGQRTFGKGSVQQLIPVETTGGNTRLKLTIAKYYLPNGECIHGRDRGIAPHVEIDEPEVGMIERDARWKIHDNREIELWLEKHFEKNEQAFRELLEFDEYDPAKYPEIEQLRAELQKKHTEAEISEELVRKELRFALRTFLRDKYGEEDHSVDIQESVVLQRALVALGEQMEGGLPDVPLYNVFRDKFQKKEQVAANDRTEAEKEPAKP